ncbi:hypothetical protein [Sphingobacterium multivorum]|uniref:hypothetical protein n=1 Tax=Sphingobacterium multivorum TaxID=28454 RepID=UPI003DA41821
MSNLLNQQTLPVEPEEIVFFFKHCDGNVKNVIFERLKKEHPKITKRLIDKEVTKLKKRYNPLIIGEVRGFLKDQFGLEFNPKNN